MNKPKPSKWIFLIILLMTCEIGLLFFPGGVIAHSQRIIRTGCDKKVSSAAYYDPYSGTTGTQTYIFCGGSPPYSMNPFYQLGSNRRFQMGIAWLLILAGIYFPFQLRRELDKPGALGGVLSCVAFYLFGTLWMVL